MKELPSNLENPADGRNKLSLKYLIVVQALTHLAVLGAPLVFFPPDNPADLLAYMEAVFRNLFFLEFILIQPASIFALGYLASGDPGRS